MKSKIVTGLIVGLLLPSMGDVCGAASVTYDFTNGASNFQDSLLFTVSGVGVTVTAKEVVNDDLGGIFSLNDAAPGDGTYGVYDGSTGLGAKSYSGDSDSDVDGSSSVSGGQYIHDDGLLFTFGSPVGLTYLNFGTFGSNDDFNLTVDGVTHLIDFDTTKSSPHVTATNNLDEYWFTGLVGSEILIWADGSNDDYRIQAMTINTTPVPEPSTCLLLSVGFAGLALYRRKQNPLFSKHTGKSFATRPNH